MFLNRQTPSLSDRTIIIRPVVLNMDEVGKHDAERLGNLPMRAHQDKAKRKQNEQIVRREDLQTAPDEETRQIELAGRPNFLEEQPANQETAENEEQIHAASAKPF